MKDSPLNTTTINRGLVVSSSSPNVGPHDSLHACGEQTRFRALSVHGLPTREQENRRDPSVVWRASTSSDISRTTPREDRTADAAQLASLSGLRIWLEEGRQAEGRVRGPPHGRGGRRAPSC